MTRTPIRLTAARAAALAAITMAAAAPLTPGIASADIAPPPPVTGFQVHTGGEIYGNRIVAEWWPTGLADGGRVCYVEGPTAPASATDPSCGPISEHGGEVGTFTGGTHMISLSAFSYASATQAYGAPVSATVTVTDEAPPAPSGLATKALSATSLQLGWYGRGDSPVYAEDVVETEVTVSPGTIPDPGAAPHVVAGGSSRYTATGLVPGNAYTFSVRLHDKAGQWGPTATLVAATRIPGVYLMRSSTGFTDQRIPGAGRDTDWSTSVNVTSAGHVRALVVTTAGHIVYTSRTPTRGWSTPVRLGGGDYPHLAVSPTGTIVAQWRGAYRVRAAGSATWGRTRHLPLTFDMTLADIEIDRHGALHVLASRFCDQPGGGCGGGLYYLTNTGGRWHSSRLPGTGQSDGGELAYDVQTDAIALLVTHYASTDHGKTSTTSLRVGRASATATTFRVISTRRTVNTTDASLTSSHLAAHSGRISVVTSQLDRTSALASGVFILTGTTPATVGHWQRLPGTSEVDVLPVTSAFGANGLSLSWLRVDRGWDKAKQGVWNASLTYNSMTGWSTKDAEKTTSTEYDQPLASYRDAAGRRYTATARLTNDYVLPLHDLDAAQKG